MKNSKILFWTFSIVLMLSFQSCATIFGGRHNVLVFENLDNTPAQVFLNDSLIGDAAGKMYLPKGVIQHGSTLEIKVEGQEVEEHLILLKPHPLYVIGDFAVGVIPLIVDFGTGDILRPTPRKFSIINEKTE